MKLLIIPLLLLSFFCYSQCDSDCNQQFLLNGSFDYDPNTWSCSNIPAYPGFAYITCYDFDYWDGTGTPDLFYPGMGFGQIDQYISIPTAALCYYNNGQHTESINQYFPISPISAPDITYYLSFDYAASAILVTAPNYQNSTLTDVLPTGSLNVSLLGGSPLTVATYNMDISNDVRNGFRSECIQLPNASSYQGIEFKSLSTSGGNANPLGNYNILINEIDMWCELNPENFEIVTTDLGNNNFEFSLNNIGGLGTGQVNITSYSWDFGDGSTILPPTAGGVERHQYSSGGIYEVCVQIKDSRDCCATICTEVTIGCDYSICLDCASSGVPIVQELRITDPITGFPLDFDVNNQGCCFNFSYCFGDPGFCQQYNGSSGFQYNDLVADINAYLQSIGDSGNAYIYTSSGMNDPNYPCRNVVIVIENTSVEFISITGIDPVNTGIFSCNFNEDCR